MKQSYYRVTENIRLTPSTWRMKLAGDTSAVTAPGQFINIRLDGRFLRRPISVCDVDDGIITIIYKVLGHGTEDMTRMETGKKLDIITGLGNGYDLSCAGDSPLLIGGGAGIPPLYLAARRLVAGAPVTVILGFNSADEVYYVDEFRETGCNVIIATADGSIGIRGFVTDAFSQLRSKPQQKDMPQPEFTHFYTCGPEPMLKAVYNTVYKEAGIPGQMSFEERMGCGFGACMGCSCRTVTGYKRICREGPVLRTDDIIW